MAARTYIGLGSNLEPERHLPAALQALAHEPGLQVRRCSPVYRTPPWGYTDQPAFLNAVVEADATLPPEALLERLLAIEAEQGRDRGPRAIRWGPRAMDLDLLLYGTEVLETARLTLPHPHLHERGFVLVPLCDLAPGMAHPVLGETMSALLARVDTAGIEPYALELHPQAADVTGA